MKKKPLKIAISGALGRMGKLLINEIQQRKDLSLNLAIVYNKNQIDDAVLKKNNITIPISHSLKNQNNKFDVLIDFSHPQGTMEYLDFCLKHKKSMVIGTTGFNTQEQKKIYIASKKIKIVKSSNFSIGINIIHNILHNITKTNGKNLDIEIIEYHHRNKIDAPSGTAIELGETILKSMNLKIENNSIFNRYGNTGIRPNQKIGFSSIRAGNIVGKHTILFANNEEQIEITHKAINRLSFVKGAIQAAKWIVFQNAGLFNMQQVLNF